MKAYSMNGGIIMINRFDGKVVLITGAGSGLGQALLYK